MGRLHPQIIRILRAVSAQKAIRATSRGKMVRCSKSQILCALNKRDVFVSTQRARRFAFRHNGKFCNHRKRKGKSRSSPRGPSPFIRLRATTRNRTGCLASRRLWHCAPRVKALNLFAPRTPTPNSTTHPGGCTRFAGLTGAHQAPPAKTELDGPCSDDSHAGATR
jgi:hypothetical protein